jgi:hypothetical protein
MRIDRRLVGLRTAPRHQPLALGDEVALQRAESMAWVGHGCGAVSEVVVVVFIL